VPDVKFGSRLEIQDTPHAPSVRKLIIVHWNAKRMIRRGTRGSAKSGMMITSYIDIELISKSYDKY
jgi:hypothetical protein